MDKIPNKYAKLIRIICYILIPIAILAIVQSIISLWYYEQEEKQVKASSFFESNQFANLYKESILNNVQASYIKEVEFEYPKEVTDEKINESDNQYTLHISNYYGIVESNVEGNKIYYKNYLENKNLKFLIIDNKTNTAITNMNQTLNTDTIEEIKKELSNYSYFWNYEQKNVNTNISLLSLENIAYESHYTDLKQYDCTIYTGIKVPLEYHDYYYNYEIVYDKIVQPYDNAMINLLLGSLILLTCMTLITIYVGKEKGKNEIVLNTLDKIPYEIVVLFVLFVTGITLSVIDTINLNIYNMNMTTAFIIIIASAVFYIVGMLFYLTSITRMKAHTLWKSTIVYYLYRLIKKGVNSISSNLSLSIKLGIVIITYTILILFCILLIFSLGPVAIPFLLGIWSFMFYWGLRYLKQLKQMKQMVKELYEGNTQIRLTEEEYKGDLKEVCIYLNDIAGGFQNAINKSLKSERMKTELITNVSHDIKTPLTSIINYVDLLKKEEMPNEKTKQYLDVLDQKSQRLKRLTEDLVEASKASSGNIKLNIEKIDIKELIKQVSGEFEDRLNEKKLELLLNLPEENAIITADSRYLYRVMENLYSNIVKYALPQSRVYVDVILQKDTVEINLKNISKEKLNISAEELMERFVRGESSRNTEGSGLGLSIAQSLIELQKGTFQIYLDGDLFKVILTFQRKQ